jgi:hypothetical protein
MPPPKFNKYEHAIPLAFLDQFKQEARLVIPETRAGVWVFPPGWITKVDPNLAKSLEGYSLVAVPNAMLNG